VDLLGFIRPNQDFSMGYSEKNKKNPVSFRLGSGRLARRGFDPSSRQMYNTSSDFRKEMHGEFATIEVLGVLDALAG
jgi:hypothetical protein